MPSTSVAARFLKRTPPSRLKIISAAGVVSSIASRSACAASTRRRDSAVTVASSRVSLSACASSRSRACTACTIFANELNSTPISSDRSVCCAAVKSPCSMRRAESVRSVSGSSTFRLIDTTTNATTRTPSNPMLLTMVKNTWRRRVMMSAASCASCSSRSPNAVISALIGAKSVSLVSNNAADVIPGCCDDCAHSAIHRLTVTSSCCTRSTCSGSVTIAERRAR